VRGKEKEKGVKSREVKKERRRQRERR